MKVPIQAANAPAIWQEGGTAAVLRAENLKGFTTTLGQFVPPSSGNRLYLEVDITISAEEPMIPQFEVDSTDDCFPWDSDVTGDVPGYKFSIVTSKKKIIPYFPRCRVPTLADGDPSITWLELRALNRARKRQVIPQRFIPEMVVQAWIQAAVGALNKGNSINTGVVALTDDPLDPVFPIAVGANNALWQSLSAGTGLVIESGTAVLVNGSVTVASTLVLSTSKIFPVSMDANVTGALRVESVVPGVSFRIVSNEVGNAGAVAWMMTG